MSKRRDTEFQQRLADVLRAIAVTEMKQGEITLAFPDAVMRVRITVVDVKPREGAK